MELSDFRVCGLVDDLPGYVQLGALRVEVEVLDADFEVEVYACGGRGAGVLYCCYAPDGAGAEDVVWSDEVVCVPLERC